MRMDETEKDTIRGRRGFCKLAALSLISGGVASGIAARASQAAGTSLTATIVDRSGQPVEYAVLSLHNGAPSHAPASTVAVMDQRRLQFAPEVIALQTGTTVSFPNQDDVRHHVYSFSHPNAFELKLYHGENGGTHQFEYPGIVVLGCNIHDGMIGYMRVVDTPYFATTNAQGKLTISNAAAGKQTLQLWHPDLGMRFIEKSVELGDGSHTAQLTLDIGDRAPAAATPKPASKFESLFRD